MQTPDPRPPFYNIRTAQTSLYPSLRLLFKAASQVYAVHLLMYDVQFLRVYIMRLIYSACGLKPVKTPT